MDKEEVTTLAVILGFLLGTAIIYAAVSVTVWVFPWLTENLGLAGAITVCAILASNLYALVGRE